MSSTRLFPLQQPGSSRLSLGWTTYLDDYDAWLNEQSCHPVKLTILKSVILYARQTSADREYSLTILAAGQQSLNWLFSVIDCVCRDMSGDLTSQPKTPNSRLYDMLNNILDTPIGDPYSQSVMESKNETPRFTRATQASAIADYIRKKKATLEQRRERFYILFGLCFLLMLTLTKGYGLAGLIEAMLTTSMAYVIADGVNHSRLFPDITLRNTAEFTALQARYNWLVRDKSQSSQACISLRLAMEKESPDTLAVLQAIEPELKPQEIVPWIDLKEDPRLLGSHLSMESEAIQSALWQKSLSLEWALPKAKKNFTYANEQSMFPALADAMTKLADKLIDTQQPLEKKMGSSLDN